MDYLSILIICIVIVTTITKISAEINDNYAVVLDCGSTGSRAFVFRILTDTETNSRKITSIQGGKVRPGLSTFSKELEKVSSYLEPLIANTTEFVPIEKQRNTILYIRGTAGMRLLTDSEQKNIWNSLATGLKRSRTIPYVVNTNNFGTITGHMEAFYAVLASNYIAGCIDTYSR